MMNPLNIPSQHLDWPRAPKKEVEMQAGPAPPPPPCSLLCEFSDINNFFDTGPVT